MALDYPDDAGTWGRGLRSEWLRNAGLRPDTPEWEQGHRELAAIAAAHDEKRARNMAERQAARFAPWLAEARENVLAWVCIEEMPAGEDRDAAIEAGVIEEAERLADEADEAALEAEEARERHEEEAADLTARSESLAAAVAAAEAAVAAAGWSLEERRCSHDSSRYYWLKSPADEDGDCEIVFAMRISDHRAKNGAGWNEAKQEHHDEPDINIVLRCRGGGQYTFDLAPLVKTLGR